MAAVILILCGLVIFGAGVGSRRLIHSNVSQRVYVWVFGTALVVTLLGFTFIVVAGVVTV